MNHTEKLALVLDWDGIVNAPAPSSSWGVSEMTSVSVDFGWGGGRETIDLTFAPALVEALDTLIERLDLRLIWVTSWSANRAILPAAATVGLRAIGDVAERTPGPLHSWKVQTMLRLAASGPRFVWADDLVPHDVGWGTISQIGGEHEPPNLILAPETWIGLEPKHLLAIEQWVAAVRESETR